MCVDQPSFSSSILWKAIVVASDPRHQVRSCQSTLRSRLSTASSPIFFTPGYLLMFIMMVTVTYSSQPDRVHESSSVWSWQTISIHPLDHGSGRIKKMLAIQRMVSRFVEDQVDDLAFFFHPLIQRRHRLPDDMMIFLPLQKKHRSVDRRCVIIR